MREIKFRGWGIHVKRWIFGDLLTASEDGRAIQYYDEEDGWMCDNVNEKTVGQFTGLYDCNGREIYEDDIVDLDYIIYDPWDDAEKILNPMRCVVVYEDFGFRFKKEEDLSYLLHDVTNIKIVGNIHDNPKLMESPIESEYKSQCRNKTILAPVQIDIPLREYVENIHLAAISWEEHLKICKNYGTSQSPEQIAKRGGFGILEAAKYYHWKEPVVWLSASKDLPEKDEEWYKFRIVFSDDFKTFTLKPIENDTTNCTHQRHHVRP